MENKGLKLNTFNLILGVIGAIVTIVSSIGGSYVTTQITLTRHDERIKSLETKYTNTNIRIDATNSKVDKYLELLQDIRESVAVIEERTKNK